MAALLSRRTRRVTVALATVLLFFVLAGVTYQSVSNALERRRYRHPGKLVDVGDHQLHLYCVGEGRPIVVLEAPAGGMSMNWAWVQNALASTTRVCSYDRAGLGWSEAGDEDYNPARVPDDLHSLLHRAGEHGPYVIAGHELGAVFAEMFAVRYPREVVALVLVGDPADTRVPASSVRMSWTWPWLARIGLLRATRSLSKHASGLPGSASAPSQAFLNRPDHLTRAAQEVATLDTITGSATVGRIDEGIAVTTVKTGQENPPVMLGSSEEAGPVTRALTSAIERARAR